MDTDLLQMPVTPRELYTLLDSNWFFVLVVLTTTVVSVVTVLLFSLLPFYIHKDSALFQHAGWWITQGGDLYVDIWDLKPPLIYFVTTLLALVSSGDMALLHVLSVIVAGGTVIAGITLVGVLTHRLTDDGFAGLVAGVTMLVLTSIYAFPFAGIRPKYFAVCCGMGGLLLAVDDRPFRGGLVGAAAAGFWQLGVVIPVLVVAISLQQGGAGAVGRAVGGGLVMTALTILPFVLNGTVVPLFVETVLAPIYGVERFALDARLIKLLIQLGPGVAIIPLGIVGWGWALIDDYSRYWWVAVGGVGYLSQLLLEFQGAIELILLVAFLSLGVGLLVAHASVPGRQSVIAGCIVLLVVTSASWNATTTSEIKLALEAEYDQRDINNYHSLPDDPEGWPSMQTIYWQKLQPEYCHYRLGVKQQYFAQETGGSLYKTSCGQWPYEEPPVEWVRGALLGV